VPPAPPPARIPTAAGSPISTTSTRAGDAWKWFLDIFAFAGLVFALTGLVLLWLHAQKRRITWPLVAAGLAIPAAVAIIFIH
jgi:hypothetical protein